MATHYYFQESGEVTVSPIANLRQVEEDFPASPPFDIKEIRAADAKEVGVGNPAEETCCYPNKFNVTFQYLFVNSLRSRVAFATHLLALPQRILP